MKNTFLSRFTPSMMPPEALEAIFVQRERLAARTVEHVRESVLTGPPSNTLFVGPRGIGKTHLISLIYHRLKAAGELQDNLAVAWLPEDEAGIASFLDLLIAVLQALMRDDPTLTSWLEPRLDALLDSATPEPEAKILLREAVGDRALLLLAENLDDIFAGIRDAGQKALRAFLQETRFVTLVVTAQGLFGGVSRHASPFYGFFRVEHLVGLNLDEAVELLIKIARHQEKPELVSFLQSPAGRARVRAVDHLTAGNPRLYVIFSEFLTREALDELVPPFMDMLEDLTPYYQAKMRSLSPQQRKIVDFLSGIQGALPVKEIARRTLIGATTAAAQLKSLREDGYVRAQSVGRETYYELKEPLMRLCLDVKKQRGEPIKLFVEFLRLWCPPEELERRLAALPSEAPFTRASLREALRLSATEENPLYAACRLDYKRYIEQGESERANQVLEELQTLGDPTALALATHPMKDKPSKSEKWFGTAKELFDQGRFEDALAALEQCLALDPQNIAAWHNKGLSLGRLGCFEESLTAFDQSLALNPQEADAWHNKGVTLFNLGRFEEALTAYERSLALNPQEANAWHNKGVTLFNLGRFEEALTAYEQSLALNPQNANAWYNKGMVLGRLGRFEETLKALDQTLAHNPQNANAWYSKGVTLFNLGRFEEALVAFDCALQIQPEQPEQHMARVETLFALGRWEEGLVTLTDVVSLLGDAPETLAGATAGLVQQILTSDVGKWPPRAETFIVTYATHEQALVLGQALVQSVSGLRSTLISPDARRLWQETWLAQANGRSEFTLPLRLLDVAVRFLNSGDPPDTRILLELQVEERSLLKPLLGIAESEENED